MVSILFLVKRDHLHLVLLSFHHLDISNNTIVIGVIILEHPSIFEELLEISVVHLSGETMIEESIHNISTTGKVPFLIFLGRHSVMVLLMETEMALDSFTGLEEMNHIVFFISGFA